MTASCSAPSFDAFYRSQNRRLFLYIRKRVGRDAAPDLVQEAFMRMLRSGALERTENPQAYLTRTAHNLVTERARQATRTQAISCPFDEGRDAAVPPDQIRRIAEIDIRRAFRPTLLAMPPRTRRIFLMSRLRQQTYREIADELGVSDKVVERHLSQALARCRRAFVTRYT